MVCARVSLHRRGKEAGNLSGPGTTYTGQEIAGRPQKHSRNQEGNAHGVPDLARPCAPLFAICPLTGLGRRAVEVVLAAHKGALIRDVTHARAEGRGFDELLASRDHGGGLCRRRVRVRVRVCVCVRVYIRAGCARQGGSSGISGVTAGSRVAASKGIGEPINWPARGTSRRGSGFWWHGVLGRDTRTAED